MDEVKNAFDLISHYLQCAVVPPRRDAVSKNNK